MKTTVTLTLYSDLRNVVASEGIRPQATYQHDPYTRHHVISAHQAHKVRRLLAAGYAVEKSTLAGAGYIVEREERLYVAANPHICPCCNPDAQRVA